MSPELAVPRTGGVVVARAHAWARLLAFAALAALSALLYLRVPGAVALLGANADEFLRLLLGLTALAAAATWLALATRRAPSRAARWVELGVILAAGLAFRALFVAQPPALSHDAYRYAWDAQLVAHGVSPWTHIVTDPALAPLRDAAIWPQVNWRDAVTIYPPGAQILYLAVHAVAPLNVYAIKAAMALCDVLVGGLTLLLLRQQGLDPRRVIVYWWNPIPILEFTYTGHVDAAATLWTLGAVLVAGMRWRGSRVAAGALLGLAVATKLYPALFALALVRRRDWGFLAGLAGTVALVYLPFLPLGVGSGGFLGTYFAQRFVDEGIVFRLITTVVVAAPIQLALQALALAGLCSLTLWLRLRRGLPTPAGILLLSVAWIAVSPHLFPWYVGALLPFLALYLRLPAPARTQRAAPDRTGSYPSLAFGLWLFVLAMPFTYVIFAPGHDANLFPWLFIIPLAVALLPLLPSLVGAGRPALLPSTVRMPGALTRLWGGARLEE
jgi:Glycosyltransferase family 87